MFNDIVFFGNIYVSDEEYKLDSWVWRIFYKQIRKSLNLSFLYQFTIRIVLFRQVSHNHTKHAILLRHIAHSDMLYESYGELKLNTSTYSLSNVINLKLHEITLDVHLDQYDNLNHNNNYYYYNLLS